jgi:hypothetical protein
MLSAQQQQEQQHMARDGERGSAVSGAGNDDYFSLIFISIPSTPFSCLHSERERERRR